MVQCGGGGDVDDDGERGIIIYVHVYFCDHDDDCEEGGGGGGEQIRTRWILLPFWLDLTVVVEKGDVVCVYHYDYYYNSYIYPVCTPYY